MPIQVPIHMVDSRVEMTPVSLFCILQESAAATVLKSDLSVRQTELLVKRLGAERKKKPAPTTGVTVNYAEEAAKELGSRLGRTCRIVTGRKKGRLELDFYGTDDLNELLDALYALKKK